MLANRFRTGSLVSATSWQLFDRIALVGSRQVRCVSDVLARWTSKNDQTYEPIQHFLDTVFTYFVLWQCDTRSLMSGLTHEKPMLCSFVFTLFEDGTSSKTNRLEQAAMTWSSSATSAMFTYTTHLSKYRSGHTAQVRSMGFIHVTHEQVFGLASMVDFRQSDTTCTQVSDQQARRSPAGLQQVYSRFPEVLDQLA